MEDLKFQAKNNQEDLHKLKKVLENELQTVKELTN